MISNPDLKITVDSQESLKLVTLRATRTGAEESFLVSPKNSERIRDLRRSLSGRLQEFHKSVVSLQDSPAAVKFETLDDAILALRAIGHEFVQCFWDDDLSDIENDDQRRWYAVLAAAFAFDQGDRRNVPARIELIVDPKVELLDLPIEIMPIMDPRGELRAGDPIVDEASLQRALLVFPAFSAVITRRHARSFDTFTEISRSSNGRIPIKIIRNDEFYANLDEQKQVEVSEVEWLRKQEKIFHVEPPWPPAEKINLSVAAQQLGICLLNPKALLDSHLSSREWPDQIQHFSCHYTSTAYEHTLGLRKAPGKLSLNISVLSLVCDQERGRAMPDDHHRPLIFLNACGSAGAALHGGRSMTDLLVEKIKPRAIVATLTPIHFPLAASFARQVYQGLIDNWPLGEAIRSARWWLVENRLQPFGALYVLFGEPELQISSQVDGTVAI